MYDPTSKDPTKNIFAYGGNTTDAQTGQTTPVAPTIKSINSGNLAPQGSINYTTPNPTPPPSITGLNTTVATPELPLSPAEQKGQDLGTRLQALNDSMVGKSAYTSQQETAQGVPALLKTQTDLSNQLKSVQNEALQIPLQLQQEATGRGITVGGLAPLQTARLRTNAIQALGVNSLLASSQGNIALAQNLVDRAVAAKYDPIKEQIDAATKNLDIILKSPAYTAGEKNRAQQQLDIQNAKARAIAKQEENSKIANAMAGAAVKNNPGDQKAVLAAQELLKLDPSSPDYLARAFGLVGQYQSDPAQTQKDLDAHLQAQANINKTKADTANAPLDAEYKKAQIAQIYANIAVNKAKNSVLSVTEAKALGVPYGTTKGEAQATGKVPGAASEASALKEQASTSVEELLAKFDAHKGTSAVGKSGLLNSFGYGYLPGTERADFVVQFKNLKSLLSLGAVKYLKGQGQVSDAERRLLAEASSKLDLSQSEDEFRKSLVDMQKALSGPSESNGSVDPYASERAGTPPGQIFITRNGTPGYIPESEFNPSTDQRL